ncbi:MAG: hypothetical protein Q4B50_06515 [Bacillota bacterium]|nr:hypothetical protein [Bacillota bacterium]
MKTKTKRIMIMSLSLLLLLFLASCGREQQGGAPTPNGNELIRNEEALKPGVPEKNEELSPESSSPESPAAAQELSSFDPAALGGSYWKAVKYKTADGWSDFPLPGYYEETYMEMDVFFYGDGTARLRELEGDIYWDGDSPMAMTGNWDAYEDGVHLSFSEYLSPVFAESIPAVEYGDPHFRYVDGSNAEEADMAGALTLDYYGGEVYFVQQEMPEKGHEFLLADLEGQWQLHAYEVEGSFCEVSEYDPVETLFFWHNGGGHLLADYYKTAGEFSSEIRMEGMPLKQVEINDDYLLFMENGNEAWYVELGMEGQAKTADHIVSESFSVAMIDLDTLLIHYVAESSMEPYMVGVSYTYKRVGAAE